MIKMRETERSLVLYFLIAGCFQWYQAQGLRRSAGPSVDLQGPAEVLLVVTKLSMIAFGLAFIVAGIRLKTELPRGARWIRTMIGASIVVYLLKLLLAIAISSEAAGQRFVGVLIGVALTVYLATNTARLAAEARRRAEAPPAEMPTAEVR
jgi:hypothetical protein